MTAAEGSFLGIAKQTALGTPNVTDNAFKYLLFNQGAVAPQNLAIPLDTEVGGGALLRNVTKVGVTSGGALEFIPRPEMLGTLLLGAFGNVSSALKSPSTTAYEHTFTLPTDQFAAPYFTIRSAPGNLWGEQLQDVRVSALGLEWRGAQFVRGTVGFQGGLPTKVATTTWSAASAVDNGPQLLSPLCTIELPAATPVKVLSGSFTAGMAIPLDEQWIVGSYSPDAQDIVSRSFAVSLVMKITDATLYSKMTYDPAGGSAWAASLFREASMTLKLVSDVKADAANNLSYQLTLEGNGSSGAAANIVWSASPIGLRAGRQVIIAVNGVFLADATLPIRAKLINLKSSY
jgi:hypothetical protein